MVCLKLSACIFLWSTALQSKVFKLKGPKKCRFLSDKLNISVCAQAIVASALTKTCVFDFALGIEFPSSRQRSNFKRQRCKNRSLPFLHRLRFVTQIQAQCLSTKTRQFLTSRCTWLSQECFEHG